MFDTCLPPAFSLVGDPRAQELWLGREGWSFESSEDKGKKEGYPLKLAQMKKIQRMLGKKTMFQSNNGAGGSTDEGLTHPEYKPGAG